MPEEPNSPLRSVDDDAIVLARELLRASPQGSLATLSPETGWPAASLVTVATLPAGDPLILISSLSWHTQALRADPRCGLLLGKLGKGDPLAHPRISLRTSAQFLDRESELGQLARRRFLGRHHKAALYADFGDFSFVRLRIDSAALNGGFGKAYEMTPEQLLLSNADLEQFAKTEASAIDHMNQDHAEAVGLYATVLAKAKPGPWHLTGIDPEGIDLYADTQAVRIPFDPPLTSAEEIHPRMVALAKQARQANG